MGTTALIALLTLAQATSTSAACLTFMSAAAGLGYWVNGCEKNVVVTWADAGGCAPTPENRFPCLVKVEAGKKTTVYVTPPVNGRECAMSIPVEEPPGTVRCAEVTQESREQIKQLVEGKVTRYSRLERERRRNAALDRMMRKHDERMREADEDYHRMRRAEKGNAINEGPGSSLSPCKRLEMAGGPAC